MFTLLSFLLTLGILVTIHEYGHFQVARWCGVKVLRFSIGFGKPLFSRKFGQDQTEFVLAALPFGGYVKMLDERELPADDRPALSEQELARAFNRQSVWKRIAIVAAGPAANLLLAIFLYWILFMHGVMGMKPILGEVEQNSPAAQASMRNGDMVRKVGDNLVSTWQDVRWELLRQVIKAPVVEIETVDADHDVHLHQLQLGTIGKDDFENDFLDKLGLKPFQPQIPANIGEVVAGSAAEKAGLLAGDQIVSIGGVLVSQWEDFVNVVRKNPGKPINVELRRSGEIRTVTITPDSVDEGGQHIGRIGAAYRMDQTEMDKFLVQVQYPPVTALSKAFKKTWDTSIFSLKMLGSMITGEVSWKGMSGPVTIASYAGQSAHIGWKAFLGFLAVISISLGVLNLLPIPVLDGGHLLYYMVEILKGSPVSEQVMEVGQRVGLSLLGLLMACALYNDFNRLITG
ncbi:MAG: RIP metalloprotease RseP [Candidatus Methylopumilus sp.]|jgi:regulator of sigma E protease